MLDAVDGLDGFQNVFQGIVHRVLAGFNGKALVTHILQGNDLLTDLLLGQLFAGNMAVLGMVRAVFTAIDTVVGKIKRGKHNDTVAIKFFLDFPGQLVDFLIFILQIAIQQDKGFLVGYTLHFAGFFQNFINQFTVVLVFLCIGETGTDFLITDEFLCLRGHDIIHNCVTSL